MVSRAVPSKTVKGFFIKYIMAKELPYFKFFCSEWTDGDITLEDFEVQGLFISICSYYWSSACEVSLQKLKKRFRNQDKNINYLLKTGIIKKKSKDISINFLDEQWVERQEKSTRNSKIAKDAWDKRKESKRNANASETQCESDTIKRREEEIRKEEKREDNNIVVDFNFDNVEKYFTEQAVKYKLDSKQLLKKVSWAYDFYKDLGFKNTKGKKIKNLNSTIKNNWIKDYDDYLLVKPFKKPTIAL